MPRRAPTADAKLVEGKAADQAGPAERPCATCASRSPAPGAEQANGCVEAAVALKSIAALTESVTEREQHDRAERCELQAEVAQLQHKLAWRTAALELLLLGVAAIAAVIWLTHWWPWR